MKTVDRARGRWREILPLLGVEPRFLVNKHGPCPICGGLDRFRFDDKEGSGSYFCNQCGAGDGVIMLRKLHKWDFKTAADEIDKVIGDCAPRKNLPTSGGFNERSARLAKVEDILAAANDPRIVEKYLTGRGLSVIPPVLLGHPALPYVENGQYRGRYPAMISPMVGPDGQLQSCLRTYIGDVPTRKKAMPPADTLNGGAVRLFEHGEALGVAEGVETAIAAYELFGTPTWAALSTTGIETFKPPPTIRHLTIYGDNDANFAGQKAAFAAASRLTRDIKVNVAIPPRTGLDWLDILNERTG